MSSQQSQVQQDRAEVESQLRDKIASKMTVATLLAGFTFAALLELLKDAEHLSSVSIEISVISLTLALALFIAAVYMYDRLNMPRKFWKYQNPAKPRPSTGNNNPVSQVGSDSKEAASSKSKADKGNRLKLIIERLHFKVHDDKAMSNLDEGVLYTYMIAVWTWVFTPAVIAALAGFSALLYSTHNEIIFRSGITVVIVVMIYYVVLRPILGKYD